MVKVEASDLCHILNEISHLMDVIIEDIKLNGSLSAKEGTIGPLIQKLEIIIKVMEGCSENDESMVFEKGAFGSQWKSIQAKLNELIPLLEEHCDADREIMKMLKNMETEGKFAARLLRMAMKKTTAFESIKHKPINSYHNPNITPNVAGAGLGLLGFQLSIFIAWTAIKKLRR